MEWMPVARWAYGLMAAFIGGGASAITSSITASMLAPDRFNLGKEMRAMVVLMLATFAVNGALSAFLYLKQAPLPEWDQINRREGDQ